MSNWKPYELCFMFLLGCFVYSFLEIACRGYTHWTMTLTGGIVAVFLFLLHLNSPPKSLFFECFCRAMGITAVEMTLGTIVNIKLGWNVWDYSDMPLNLFGQICLPFSVLWFCLCFPAFAICHLVHHRFTSAAPISNPVQRF